MELKKNVDVLKIAKVGSLVISGLGGLLATWISTKENEKTLQKLVDERLKSVEK